jgi:hypothetical protein
MEPPEAPRPLPWKTWAAVLVLAVVVVLGVLFAGDGALLGTRLPF